MIYSHTAADEAPRGDLFVPPPQPSGTDLARLYRQQTYVHVPSAIPAALIEEILGGDLPALLPHSNRNFVEGFKRGASIGYQRLSSHAPRLYALYHQDAFQRWIGSVAGCPIRACPDNDAHAAALYVYDQEGDWIGWHHDVSMYESRRFTVVIGLVQQSSRCLLQVQQGADRSLTIPTQAGDVVIFDERIRHRVTPLGRGEYRVAASFEYVVSPRMDPLYRVLSNLKDGQNYFGIESVRKAVDAAAPLPPWCAEWQTSWDGHFAGRDEVRGEELAMFLLHHCPRIRDWSMEVVRAIGRILCPEDRPIRSGREFIDRILPFS